MADANLTPLQRQMIADVVRRAGFELVGEPAPVAESLINENFRLETDRGPYFARIYRKGLDRQTVVAEHVLIGWAADRGVPAPVPILLDGKATAVTMSRHQVALFPWVEGHLLERGAITEGQASALGDLQGKTHAVLAEYAGELRAPAGWDESRARDDLGRVVDLIRFNPRPSDRDRAVVAHIEQHLALIDAHARPFSDFDHLPRQAVHGDFQERNVVFSGDTPVALVDWELAARDPRVMALLRAVTFMDLVDGPLLAAYLAAYGRHVTLSSEECTEGVEMWWQSRLHGTWVYRARYIEGLPTDVYFDNTAATVRLLADSEYRRTLAETLVRTAGQA